MSESQTITRNEILAKLQQVDEEYNQFQFSKCRDRHIVVVGSKKSERQILGNTIRRDRLGKIDEERRTKTFLMVPNDSTCNICILNLIELKDIESYEPLPDKKSKIILSPMSNIDRAIYQYATGINLIFFLSDFNDNAMIEKLINWSKENVQRQAIIVLVLLYPSSTENLMKNISFSDDDLKIYFPKGILHVNLDVSENNSDDDWQEKFFRICVGEQNDVPYTITNPITEQVKTHRCFIS